MGGRDVRRSVILLFCVNEYYYFIGRLIFMIRVGILGYGNLGRGVEFSIRQNKDMCLKAVFTRRDPASVKIMTEGVPVYSVNDAAAHKDEIDVLILCGGSANDLPTQTPEYVKYFNVVDSFDTHARIPEHFADVDKAAKESGKIGVISVGWDPGLFFPREATTHSGARV